MQSSSSLLKRNTSYPRKPLGDISNKLALRSSKLKQGYQHRDNSDSGDEDDQSFELRTFRQVKYFPETLTEVSNDDLSYIQEFDSFSISNSDDSLDLLPEKYPSKKITSIDVQKKSNVSGSMGKMDTPLSTVASHVSNYTTKKGRGNFDSGSSTNADYLLLKARLESLRTKYDTLLVESEAKISHLQTEKLECERKVKDHDSILNEKLLQQQQDFALQRKEEVEIFEREKSQFEEKISALQTANSALSLSLENERQEKARLESCLQELKASLELCEKNEVALKSEISRLETVATESWKTSSLPSCRTSDSASLYIQIRALEDALTAERQLSAAKLSALRQESRDEHEQALFFTEERIRSDMHAQWKRRLIQIKESWSIKKRSLISKVTKAFERRLAELSTEWERERSSLLTRLREEQHFSTRRRYRPSFGGPNDSIIEDDLFSDSFKIDEEGIFNGQGPFMGERQAANGTHRHSDLRRDVGYQQPFKSPLLQKTPHFMSRSRMPLPVTK